MQTLFSIITINWNDAKGLRKTIESVVAQDRNLYEFIIVDGASTDNSVDVIRHYEDSIDWWCSEPDGGIYDAQNKGTRQANGKYLLFLNSGDSLYDAHVLEKVATILTAPDTPDILNGWSIMEDSGLPAFPHQKSAALQLIWNGIGHQATFIRRELQEARPYEERFRICADKNFFLQTVIGDGKTLRFTDLRLNKQAPWGTCSNREKLLEELGIMVEETWQRISWRRFPLATSFLALTRLLPKHLRAVFVLKCGGTFQKVLKT